MNRYIKLEDAISICGPKLILADGAAIGQRHPTPDENVTALLDLQTIEVSEGEWVWDENGIDWNLGAWRCSECHGRNANLPNDKTIIPWTFSGSKFCPNCGAKMKRAGDE